MLDNIIETVTGDLRVALAVAGGLLLLLLAGWEFWQRRKARRADDAHVAGAFGRARSAMGEGRDPLLERGTPSAGLEDEISEVRIIEPSRSPEDDAALDLPEIGARDRLADPPVVDLEAALGPVGGSRDIPVVDSVTLTDEAALPPAATLPAATPTVVTPPAIVAPIVAAEPAAPAAAAARAEWPAEQERRIVGLRIVARNGERFTGSSVRQALQGEGFVHGDMQIFHRVTGDGRALLSAASLTRPGSFDLATMDSLLYRGLNLFAVLPGPLPGRDTVDKLLLAGHTIAQRLRGELQDSRGEPLTESRLSEMRRGAASPVA